MESEGEGLNGNERARESGEGEKRQKRKKYRIVAGAVLAGSMRIHALTVAGSYWE